MGRSMLVYLCRPQTRRKLREIREVTYLKPCKRNFKQFHRSVFILYIELSLSDIQLELPILMANIFIELFEIFRKMKGLGH